MMGSREGKADEEGSCDGPMLYFPMPQLSNSLISQLNATATTRYLLTQLMFEPNGVFSVVDSQVLSRGISGPVTDTMALRKARGW